jgi:hypothetical protein
MKDLFLAVSFSALYLYQGLNESRKRKVQGRNVNVEDNQ